MRLISTCLAVVMLSLTSIIADVSAGVPNTFTPGTTAKSSEVNQNFDFVNYGNIVVKANGTEVGPFLGRGLGAHSMSTLNQQGYFFDLEMDGNIVTMSLLFTTSNCSGIAYGSSELTGQVIKSRDGRIFYLPKTNASIPIPLTVNSYIGANSPNCNAASYADMLTPLTINDPSVTGVTSGSFTPPITIERR